jgi:hypothetical protein
MSCSLKALEAKCCKFDYHKQQLELEQTLSLFKLANIPVGVRNN